MYSAEIINDDSGISDFNNLIDYFEHKKLKYNIIYNISNYINNDIINNVGNNVNVKDIKEPTKRRRNFKTKI
jgi:hypothetical protein